MGGIKPPEDFWEKKEKKTRRKYLVFLMVFCLIFFLLGKYASAGGLTGGFSNASTEVTLQAILDAIATGGPTSTNAYLASIDGKVSTATKQDDQTALLQSIFDDVATAVKQDIGNASLSSIDGKLTTTNSTLSTISSNTGTTATNTTTLNARVGDLTETAPANDTASSGLNGRLQRIAQRLTSLIAFFTSDFGVSSGSIRVAAQVGNATGAANFNSGATGAQTLRTASNLYDGLANALTSHLISSDRALDVDIRHSAQLESPGAFRAIGNVATIAMTQVAIMRTAYTYTGSNTTPYIASASLNDTLAGTGAQKITITYFKADGTGPFTDTENMQGVTGFFASTTMAFIQSVVCSQVGTGGTNAGTILVSNLAPLSTMASINAGETETFYAHHFVPLGKTAFITSMTFGSAATAAGQGGIFLLRKQTIPFSGNPIRVVTGNIELVGTSSTQNVNFVTPIQVQGPAVIFSLVTPNSATANTFSDSFGGYEQ